MTKEQLEKRIAEIKQVVEQSTANHNAILGRLLEAQYMLEMVNKEEIIDSPSQEVI